MTHEQAMEYAKEELELAEQCLEMETLAGNEPALNYLIENVAFCRYTLKAIEEFGS